MKAVPCYVNFVSGVTLWDRGVYHYTHNHHSERPSPPCPRFIAHMATSPGAFEPPGIFNTKPKVLPERQRVRHREVVPTPRNAYRSSVFSRGPQSRTFRSDIAISATRKLPFPSMASSEEDPMSPRDPTPTPVATETKYRGPQEPSREEKTAERAELEITGRDDEDAADLDELDKLRRSVSPFFSESEDFSRPVSSKFGHRMSFISNDGRNQPDVSGSHSLGRASSTPLSQLRPAMSQVGFSGSELWGGSSRASQDPLHTGSPLVVSSFLDPEFRSYSSHGSVGLHQDSASSWAQEGAEQAQAFVELWHERLLQPWPVLPPISPQRGSGSTSEVRSLPSSRGSDTSDAFSEHEEIASFTGSSASQRDFQYSMDEDGAAISEISKQAGALHLGCDSEGGLLVDVRLSLLDHQSWAEGEDVETDWKDPVEWDFSFNYPARSVPESPIGSSAATYQGARLHPAPDTLEDREPPEPPSEQGPGQEERGGHTLPTNFTSSEWMKTGLASPASSLPRHAAETSNEDADSHSTDIESPCQELWDTPTSATRGLIGGESMTEDGEERLSKHVQKSQDGKVSKNDRDAQRREDGCHVKSEKVGEAGRTPPLVRRRPIKLDLSFRQEAERQQKAEERRARALQIYSKLRDTQTPGNRAAEQLNISNFEDFDFLAKYCIFSQEELAKYKRAFEAVDSNGDGYLDCLQVLLALKEIVPPEALTDAEELYVYRILEIVDYYVTDGLTDLRLFAVMASLARKIASLDSFMRSLIGRMDFKGLEMKMYNAKQLFLCNIDPQCKSITVEQLLVELKAGGISQEHEEDVQRELRHVKQMDILDFLTYLPLFVLIHNSVISNPLNDSRSI